MLHFGLRIAFLVKHQKFQDMSFQHQQVLQYAERFRNIHIDLVGPLPSCQGYRYCLTCVDRYTRWPEVLPIQDIAAETVAKALYTGWITRFGVPEVITTDQGTQFESLIFNNTIKLLGIMSKNNSIPPSSKWVGGAPAQTT